MAFRDTDSKHFAMTYFLKGKDSATQYVEDRNWPAKSANIFMSQDHIRHQIENEYQLASPLGTAIYTSSGMEGFLASFAGLVLGLMLFLANIVSNSLMTQSIVDKTYDNAMLRCLGWNTRHIALITAEKTALFVVAPGAFLGLLACYAISIVAQKCIRDVAQFNFSLPFTIGAVLVGLCAAVVLPVMATLSPLAKTVNMELRDALNTFRRKTDDLTVRIKTLENHYGLSINQLLLGILGTAFGCVFFVLLPASIINGDRAGFFFWNSVVFVCLTIGIIHIARMSLPLVAELIATILTTCCCCCFRGLRKLRPLISKNLRAHKDKNTKSGVMMLTTVMFLIFLNSFSEQLTTLMMEGVRNFLGGDITAYAIDFAGTAPATDAQKLYKEQTGFESFAGGSLTSLDAVAIAGVLDSKELVQNYEFVSYPLARMFAGEH